MSGPIKQGDMVMLVWACCAAGRRYLGWIGSVEDVEDVEKSGCVCDFCTSGMHAWVGIWGRGVVPLSWLVKIDPPLTSKQQHLIEELMA